jgi:hypothetical protein
LQKAILALLLMMSACVSVNLPVVTFSAERTSEVYGQDGLAGIGPPYWSPSADDVQSVRNAIAAAPNAPSNPSSFGYQFLGVTENGRRYIHINAFCRSAAPQNPYRTLIYVGDGGPCYFVGEYDVVSGKAVIGYHGPG